MQQEEVIGAKTDDLDLEAVRKEPPKADQARPARPARSLLQTMPFDDLFEAL